MVLPLELSQIIMDCLIDDPKTLAACSSVCSSWLHYTRRRLCSKDIPLFIRDGMKREATNQYDFIHDLISSPHCTIVPYVRKLSVIGTASPVSTIVLAGLFTAVTSLTLTDFIWYNLEPCTTTSFSAMFPRLMDLTIAGSETMFESNTEFYEFICAFPDLVRLSIEHVDMGWALDEELDIQQTHLPSSLTALTVTGYRTRDILNWVLAHEEPAPAIREFSVGAVALAEIPTTALYLEHLGANLETLTFDLGEEFPRRLIAPEFFTDIDFTVNPRLSKIHIHSFPNPSIDPKSTSWIYGTFSCQERSLFHVATNQTMELILHMSHTLAELADPKIVHNWSALDEVFSQSPFQPRLKVLRFCLPRETTSEKECEKISILFNEQLPACRDLGIFSVERA